MTQFHFVPTAETTATARIAQESAISLRVSNESSERTKQTLERHMRKARKISPASCAFLCAVSNAGVDFASVYNSTKQSEGSENLFNEKAIPKVWELAAVLNGGAWDMASIEGFTLHCVTVALANGVSDNTGIQRVMHKLSMPRSATGAGYTGGTCSTQVSSSCRALEALGVVKARGARAWEIANPALFTECARASGAEYIAPDSAPAPDTADDSGIVTIDGEAYEIPDMLAIAAPVATPDSAPHAVLAIAAPVATPDTATPASAPHAPRKRAPRKSKGAK